MKYCQPVLVPVIIKLALPTLKNPEVLSIMILYDFNFYQQLLNTYSLECELIIISDYIHTASLCLTKRTQSPLDSAPSLDLIETWRLTWAMQWMQT